MTGFEVVGRELRIYEGCCSRRTGPSRWSGCSRWSWCGPCSRACSAWPNCAWRWSARPRPRRHWPSCTVDEAIELRQRLLALAAGRDRQQVTAGPGESVPAPAGLPSGECTRSATVTCSSRSSCARTGGSCRSGIATPVIYFATAEELGFDRDRQHGDGRHRRDPGAGAVPARRLALHPRHRRRRPADAPRPARDPQPDRAAGPRPVAAAWSGRCCGAPSAGSGRGCTSPASSGPPRTPTGRAAARRRRCRSPARHPRGGAGLRPRLDRGPAGAGAGPAGWRRCAGSCWATSSPRPRSSPATGCSRGAWSSCPTGACRACGSARVPCSGCCGWPASGSTRPAAGSTAVALHRDVRGGGGAGDRTRRALSGRPRRGRRTRAARATRAARGTTGGVAAPDAGSVAHAEPAVDRDHGAVDVAGGVAGQPRDDRGHLLGRGHPPAGMALRISALRASVSSVVMSVSMKPGATTFAVMLRVPSSRVIDRASPTRPALLAA